MPDAGVTPCCLWSVSGRFSAPCSSGRRPSPSRTSRSAINSWSSTAPFADHTSRGRAVAWPRAPGGRCARPGWPAQPRTAASLGGVYALSGRPDEAVSLLERAIVHAESIGFMYGHSLVVATLAEAHLRASQLDEANGAVRQALELARQHRQRGWEARKLKLCGEIAAHPDCPDGVTADAHYSAALTLGLELGMRPLVSQCHLGLGKLYRRIGKRERAQKHLATATTMYREMDMDFWLTKAERQATALGRCAVLSAGMRARTIRAPNSVASAARALGRVASAAERRIHRRTPFAVSAAHRSPKRSVSRGSLPPNATPPSTSPSRSSPRRAS